MSFETSQKLHDIAKNTPSLKANLGAVIYEGWDLSTIRQHNMPSGLSFEQTIKDD